jgi:hypothetical protein
VNLPSDRDRREERSSTVPIAVLAAVMVYCWSFGFCLLHPVPTLWYYPLEHRWSLATQPSALAMDLYGRVLVSLLLSALGGGIAATVLGRRPLPPKIQHGWVVALVVSIAFAVLVIVAVNVGRHPIPEPLPSWYVPR